MNVDATSIVPNGITAKKDVVLVVDDNPTNLEILFQYLDRANFKVRVANNGQNALEQVKRAQPDLILLDVIMPGLDGFNTCRHLKTNLHTAHIPVVLMTAMLDSEHRQRGFEVGADDYLYKPVQYEEVVSRINLHLTLGRQRQYLQDIKRHLETLSTLATTLTSAADTITPEGVEKYLHKINSNSRTAMNIIDALLPVSENPPSK